ncbi:MAG TPA: cobalamin-dependent protein [Methanomassiliicoccales archaeon]
MQTRIEPLVDALVQGDREGSVQAATRLLQEGVPAETLVRDGIEAAMSKMDAKCTLEEFNLLEIMLVGRAALEVMKVVLPKGAGPSTSRDTVLLVTPEGDVHDLGKNIVKMVLTARGYRVVDCGRDCPITQMVSSAIADKAEVLGISGLITSVIPTVRQIRPSLEAAGLRERTLIAGGAALRQASPEDLNVDYVALDVFDGVKFLDTRKED